MMKVQIDHKDFELLLEHDQVKKRIRLIGIQLNVSYENRLPIFVGVLNGSFMFMADLMKEVSIASEVTFVRVESYEGDVKQDQVKPIMGLNVDVKDREVILIEDIVDTGDTLHYLVQSIKAQEPTSIAICTLLMKPNKLKHTLPELAYVGFEISDEFVIGYGLDYNGLGRNLKDIYKEIKGIG